MVHLFLRVVRQSVLSIDEHEDLALVIQRSALFRISCVGGKTSLLPDSVQDVWIQMLVKLM